MATWKYNKERGVEDWETAEEANALMQKPGFDEGKIARLVGIDPHRVRERLALVGLEPSV